jgi:hypothetical protein
MKLKEIGWMDALIAYDGGIGGGYSSHLGKGYRLVMVGRSDGKWECRLHNDDKLISKAIAENEDDAEQKAIELWKKELSAFIDFD